jgi:enediyne biosynthesis protein E3
MGGLVSELTVASERPVGRWRRALTAPLRLDEREVSVERRGFAYDSAAMRERTEEVGRSFLRGYHAALDEPDLAALAARLDAVPAEFRGFGHEGAGMAMALLDTLLPGRRLAAYLAGPGAHQLYIVNVGAGWILGRLPLSARSVRRRLDPILGWLALDGYGFHEGFFRWPRSVERREVPRRLRGYERRAFDQGLGRSLWFVRGGSPRRIADAITAFPAARQPDLWAGAGLAAAYAGGCEEAALHELVARAGTFAPMLAQGATFAAVTRERGRNPAAHTELACRLICDRTTAELAALCDETGLDLPPDRPDGAEPAFEVWRQRIQAALARGDARR